MFYEELELIDKILEEEGRSVKQDFEIEYLKTQNMNDTLNLWIKAIEQEFGKIQSYTIKEK